MESSPAVSSAPQVYALATTYLGCHPDEVLFVSANGWDVAGAAHAGLGTCWLNRSTAPPEMLDVTPTLIVRDLANLADQL